MPRFRKPINSAAAAGWQPQQSTIELDGWPHAPKTDRHRQVLAEDGDMRAARSAGRPGRIAHSR